MIIDGHLHVGRPEHWRPGVHDFVRETYPGDYDELVNVLLTPAGLRRHLQENFAAEMDLRDKSPILHIPQAAFKDGFGEGQEPAKFDRRLRAQSDAPENSPGGGRNRRVR